MTFNLTICTRACNCIGRKLLEQISCLDVLNFAYTSEFVYLVTTLSTEGAKTLGRKGDKWENKYPF